MEDEDMSAGDPADGNTPTSGETADGPQMENATFIDAQGGVFFKWESFANVLGCDETRCWCATKELTLVKTASCCQNPRLTVDTGDGEKTKNSFIIVSLLK